MDYFSKNNSGLGLQFPKLKLHLTRQTNTTHNTRGRTMSKARQDEWIAKSDAGEYVRMYNPTGCVMVFTTDDREACKTTDDQEAAEWCRIAADVYGRKDSHKRMWLRMV